MKKMEILDRGLEKILVNCIWGKWACEKFLQLHLLNNAIKKKKKDQGFPGGSVVKNPPANAGDTGSVPNLGRSHMPRQLNPCFTIAEPVLLSPGTTTSEAGHLEPLLCSKRSHRDEKQSPSTREQPLFSATRGSPYSNEDPAQPKVRK